MRITVSIILLISMGTVKSQDFQTRIYFAYIHQNMDAWKAVMEEMENKYRGKPDNGLLLNLIEAEYGYVAYCISTRKRREAKNVLGKAEDNVNLLLSKDQDNPRLHSLQGAFFGLRIRLEPMKAPSYGKKSEEANRRAIQLGPFEPQAWMEKANIAFYKPAAFGGSKSGAVPLYEKAVRLYEASPERTRQNWLYLNCLAGLGIAYEETGQIRNAGEVYRKLLVLEPSFKWVREDLYPSFQKNHSMN